MNLTFVHGWSVTHTNTYGGLPEAIAKIAQSNGLDISISHINLGKYISFDDSVTVQDISRAFDQALRDLFGSNSKIANFSCITHSTGGPVVRNWVDTYYGKSDLKNCPLKHLIMLAPANHGSSLAVLGKKRVSRIKSWFQGVEPGQHVLDWLSLGSEGQWSLNKAFLGYNSENNDHFPFVLTGQGIDNKLYDFINDYLLEPGSDGVVRVAGANTNCRFMSLSQTTIPIKENSNTLRLEPDVKSGIRKTRKTALGVFSQYSHSGTKKGIMASIKPINAANEPVVLEIINCLKVSTPKQYEKRTAELKHLTKLEQANQPRYSMLVLKVQDDQGNPIEEGDYDVFLLGGKSYSASALPKGFFKDRQMNRSTNNLVYYVNSDKMKAIRDGLFGIRVEAQPSKGLSYFSPGEFRSEGLAIDKILAPNETTYITITLNRRIDENVFRFSKASKKRESFKKTKPSGRVVR